LYSTKKRLLKLESTARIDIEIKNNIIVYYGMSVTARACVCNCCLTNIVNSSRKDNRNVRHHHRVWFLILNMVCTKISTDQFI